MGLFDNYAPSVGFTGTGHQPLTSYQSEGVKLALEKYWSLGFRTLRHGDCLFADAEAHEIAYRLGFNVIIHPPTNESKRAFCGQGRDHVIVLPPKPYLERNHDIVDNSGALIACPKESTEQLRSGTWATIRYARKKSKTIHLFCPYGAKP